MAPLKLCKLLCLFLLTLILISCADDKTAKFKYTGVLDASSHTWLKDRKIFVDPGHGGTAAVDAFRNGPHGVTEESINLRVALALESLLKRAGAIVYMSRRTDVDISLDDRTSMAEKVEPDILISVHHNGTIHAIDNVNYTCVLVRGSVETNPASYDLAAYLRDEFAKFIDAPAITVSDHVVFQETGARLLRNTESLCPGVIGEGGFFSNDQQALLFKDPKYNEREAEAYFMAISNYFKGGLPQGRLIISHGKQGSVLTNRTPFMYLETEAGADDTSIKDESIIITLDDVPIKTVRISKNTFRVNYGPVLYPGGHKIRFQFRNSNDHSSMVFYSSFIVNVEAGDYASLQRRGRQQLNSGNVSEGLKMLIAAYSMEATGPDAGALIQDIAGGFYKLGLPETAEYYNLALYHFHPDSSARDTKSRKPVSWYPVRYYGKSVPAIFGIL